LGSCYVAQDSLKLWILLPQPSQCWNYRHASPPLAILKRFKCSNILLWGIDLINQFRRYGPHFPITYIVFLYVTVSFHLHLQGFERLILWIGLNLFIGH
jgi:hypothetical protein